MSIKQKGCQELKLLNFSLVSVRLRRFFIYLFKTISPVQCQVPSCAILLVAIAIWRKHWSEVVPWRFIPKVDESISPHGRTTGYDCSISKK
jgi:hypothetical protein